MLKLKKQPEVFIIQRSVFLKSHNITKMNIQGYIVNEWQISMTEKVPWHINYITLKKMTALYKSYNIIRCEW